MTTKPKAGTDQWTRHQLWSRWQLVRRKEEYRSFCDTHKSLFHTTPTPGGATHRIVRATKILKLDEDEFAGVLSADAFAQVEAIRQRFGLDLIYHYSSDVSENDIVEALVFQRPYAVRPQYAVEEDGTRTPLWNEGYIRVEIDLFAAEEEVKAEVIELLRSARAVFDDKRKWKPVRYPTQMDFKVYDLLCDGRSRQQVMAAVWPEEYRAAKERLSNTDRGNLFEELCQKYKAAGHEDYDDMAYSEAYPEMEYERNKPLTTLYMRVYDSIKRVEAALDNV